MDARTALLARYRATAPFRSEEAFGAWVNTLPLAEFVELTDLPKAPSAEMVALESIARSDLVTGTETPLELVSIIFDMQNFASSVLGALTDPNETSLADFIGDTKVFKAEVAKAMKAASATPS